MLYQYVFASVAKTTDIKINDSGLPGAPPGCWGPASANAQCTAVLPVAPAPIARNVGFPMDFHVFWALQGMTRSYTSVVLVVLALHMLHVITNMNA